MTLRGALETITKNVNHDVDNYQSELLVLLLFLIEARRFNGFSLRLFYDLSVQVLKDVSWI